MREYLINDTWRSRGKNTANGSILSGGTVKVYVKFAIVQKTKKKCNSHQSTVFQMVFISAMLDDTD